MTNQRYRIRLSPQVAGQLTDLAEASHLGMASLMRLACLDLLEHPERVAELVATYLSPGECLISLDDLHAWERNRQQLAEAFDLGELLASMRVDLSSSESMRHP